MKLAEKIKENLNNTGRNPLKVISKVKPKNEEDLPSIGLLKTMIFDFEQRGKKQLARMMKRKLDRGEFTRNIDPDVNQLDAKNTGLVKNYVNLYSKSKDKDVKKYLRKYLSKWKQRHLSNIRGKTQEELEKLLAEF